MMAVIYFSDIRQPGSFRTLSWSLCSSSRILSSTITIHSKPL